MFKNAYNRVQSAIRNGAAQVAAGGSALVGSMAAHADGLDLTAVQTSITGAATQGTTVGGYVVAAVATLVVVGIVLSIVRKL